MPAPPWFGPDSAGPNHKATRSPRWAYSANQRAQVYQGRPPWMAYQMNSKNDT